MNRDGTRSALGRKNICVFAGSRRGSRPEYVAAAQELAAELVRRGYGLVYGGGNVGLMGVLADAVLERGGEVIGVIPEAFMDLEVAHGGLTELRVVGSMHERKAVMAELSEGFIALPGGVGTMEEFFEVLSWAQLALHHKPCGLLNVEGYYDRVVDFLDRAVEQEFLKPKHRALLIEADRPAPLLDAFERVMAVSATRTFDRART
ncbi:MAG TPA: TIGR00730 family Rossman fold protein [candidate division Zixibacteria bacterium]|nr:TIGR00730 family Rossman fold protein [candidate division Zixibacteria bacterium]